MRICKDHWAKLRARIADLGLSHLVARDGKEAMAQMVAELEGHKDEKNHDPLMSCNWMIQSHAMKMGGLQLMMPKEDGEPRCPICEAWEHRHDGALPSDREVTLEDFENFWINGPTDSELVYCRKLGLVPNQQ